jgi:PilZ domain
MGIRIFLAILSLLILVTVVCYHAYLILLYRQWRFHQQAVQVGLGSEQRKLLWQLIKGHPSSAGKKILANSRFLNKVLLHAISEVEVDLSISLQERELLQYKYYEIKRFFDRVKIAPSLRHTKELKVGVSVLLNKPNNVRNAFVAWCTEVTPVGFWLRLDKSVQEQWEVLQERGEFEFLYQDEQQFEHHFISKLRAAKENGNDLLLFFAHASSIELLKDQCLPSRRLDRELLVAKTQVTIDKTGNRQFIPQKEHNCSLLELSLVGAVLKSMEQFDVNEFVYLQFMGSTQRVVCYGRVEKVVQLSSQKQVHVQFLQTSRSSLNQISSLVYDL